MSDEFDTIRTKLLDFELHGITKQQKAVLWNALAQLMKDAVAKRDAITAIKVQDMQTRLNALVPGEPGAQQARLQEDITDNPELLQEIAAQKSLMIAVSTGGPRIQEKDQEYQERRSRIKTYLLKRNMDDPNPYPDLWAWYGKWSSGDLPTYQSRRKYISDLYQPLLDYFAATRESRPSEPVQEPTGWAKVDRVLESIRIQIESAKNEEEFQVVGLFCREALISLAQSVYDPSVHKSMDGVSPSEADTYRMLEGYFAKELEGSSNEACRKHAKAALVLANDLQHRRTATFRDAALCAEATRTVINIVAILSGRRNP